MTARRSLREILDDAAHDLDVRDRLATDPAGLLEEFGFGGVPARLLPEAVAHYSDSAPLDVAETLAPFVTMYRVGGSDVGAERLDDLFETLALAEWPPDADQGDEHPGAPVAAASEADGVEVEIAFGAGHEDPLTSEEDDEWGTAGESFAGERADWSVPAVDDPPALADLSGLDVLRDEGLGLAAGAMEESASLEDEWDDVI